MYRVKAYKKYWINKDSHSNRILYLNLEKTWLEILVFMTVPLLLNSYSTSLMRTWQTTPLTCIGNLSTNFAHPVSFLSIISSRWKHLTETRFVHKPISSHFCADIKNILPWNNFRDFYPRNTFWKRRVLNIPLDITTLAEEVKLLKIWQENTFESFHKNSMNNFSKFIKLILIYLATKLQR